MNIKGKTLETVKAIAIWIVLHLSIPTLKKAKLISDIRAEVSVGAIIGLVIGVVVAAYTLPTAIIAIMNETKYTDGGLAATDPAVVLMTTVGGIVVAAVFLLMLYRQTRD